MIIENPESLKNWLTNYLEPLCDADPQALAKYVMALIKKDKPEKELKSICFDQLEVFLRKETVSFVEVLFQTLSNKSYLNEANSQSVTTSTASSTTASANTTSNATASSMSTSPSNAMQIDHSSNHDINSLQTTTGAASSQPSSQQSKRSYHSRDRSKSKSRSRSRSRSKSRTPPQSRHRTSRDVDMRRGFPLNSKSGPGSRNYYEEDRSRRIGRGGPPVKGSTRRYCPPLKRGGSFKRGPLSSNSRRSRSRSRSRSKSRSRSRSRSWSYSSRSSRSRSRSRSRNRSRTRSRSRDKDLLSSKRVRQSSKSPSPLKDKDKEKDGSKKRCRDYDEKGFCMRGDLCPYDHGKDPVVMDGNVVLKLTANGAALLPTPTHGINAPSSNSYLAEPYNPEAPGIDPSGNTQIRGPISHPPPPPPPPAPHYWGPMGPPIRGPMGPSPVNAGGHFIPQMQQGRPRELVGVPTIPEQGLNANQQDTAHRTVIDTRMTVAPNSKRGRGGHRGGFQKGGYHHKRMVATENAEKCTLEVRKIPPSLNTITHLNQHFSKFGQIVNLQVCYEGDPEAALVQFASHAEALAAHRCTEAVLNNRFIKVFWHSKEQQNQQQQQAQQASSQQEQNQNSEMKDESNEASNGSMSEKNNDVPRVSVKERLGVKVPEEKVTTAISSSGTISRTVFNPALLKKLYPSATQPPPQPPKTKEEQKKEKLTKKIELQKKRQEILASYMKEQKVLVEKLEKAKSDEEKTVIRATLDALIERIKGLEEDLRKEAQEILAETAVKAQSNKSKVQIEKELLDAEMDFYNKLHKGEATLELQKRLNELRIQVCFSLYLVSIFHPMTFVFQGESVWNSRR
ncbi:RNA-binding protein 26-like protein [Dinothrombium tinctorium]|uniref:RNA-binding protein 26-like protein n=1 Tax=Dinothrombium tinctorium TaxID=1965070 RepID=A0A3S3NPS4_9ACAR|nr:RNA-binding protein 26-like protein [Dinothrombium tinctorium]RWS07144.1 RNA-binding protein 26-like protein [Dinothrombium tinctorium]